MAAPGGDLRPEQREDPAAALAAVMANPHAAALDRKIRDRAAVAAVVGMGYVGLPLAQAVHAAGFGVIGFDVDPRKVEALRRGEGYLKHLGPELPRQLASSDRFRATSDEACFAEADVVLLCVPTPLTPARDPDLSYVLRSCESVGRSLRAGQLIVLESTTYPGTTSTEVVPLIDRLGSPRGLRCGEQVFVAYSPEREDPGRAGFSTATIPRVVGGTEPLGGHLASLFYGCVVDRVHAVGSAEIAEAAKLLENIYRAVNIAMVNELKVIFDRLGIDVWEVIEAAKTKPFGFQAFYPGPGLGGHCIPIDPFYLSWKARAAGLDARFIELAGEINRLMPRHVVSRVADALNDRRLPLRGSRVLVVGVAYKADVDDVRETPAAEIIADLLSRGADVRYHDPHVPVFPRMRNHAIDLSSVPFTAEEVRATDCVLIVTDHATIDYGLLAREARLIVDTRNAMRSVPGGRAVIVKA